MDVQDIMLDIIFCDITLTIYRDSAHYIGNIGTFPLQNNYLEKVFL